LIPHHGSRRVVEDPESLPDETLEETP